MSKRLPSLPARDGQVAIDETDRAIIAALSAEGRLSMRVLAERVHTSRAGVYARVERLQRLGVITGYTAIVDPVRVGYSVSALVYLRIAQQSWQDVRDKIQHIPEVEFAALISGDDDLVLLVRTWDAQSLRDLVLNRLQVMTEIVSTKTVLILDEVAQIASETGGRVSR